MFFSPETQLTCGFLAGHSPSTTWEGKLGMDLQAAEKVLADTIYHAG